MGFRITDTGGVGLTDRFIRSYGGTKELTDALASLFTVEAVRPSQEIYVISPWVSNSPVLDNQQGQFADVFPFAEGRRIYLSDIIQQWAFHGTNVRIICNAEDTHTAKFLGLVESTENIAFRHLANNHEKGLCSNNFYLHGSMNFTYRGIHINGEGVRITTLRPDINQALLYARARWEEATIL